MNPERLPLQSADGTQINLDMLYQIAPSCFTEAKGSDGKTRRVVNFDVLRQLLGDAAADTGEEFYQFTWPCKAEARREAARPIKKTLRPVIEDSEDWDNTQNLYIEGDNLEVLKLLQKSYMGKVKMIYIDPPYNTGKDFIYSDNFAASSESHDRAQGDIDEFGNRYRRNTDSNGRFHSDWCSMIFPRLQLARTLLHEEGILLVNIGEHEVDNLKKIITEIFGSSNYIETYIWESTFRPDNSSKTMRRNAEYVLCVAKNKTLITRLKGLSKEKEGLPSLTKNSMQESILTFPADTVITYLPDGHYEAAVKDSYTLLDDVDVKDGKIVNSFRLKGRMIWGQENLEREIANGTEIIIKSDGFVPYTKKPGDSEMAPNKLIPNEVVGDILSSNAEMAQLFEEKVFSYPKPVSLLKYLVSYLDDKNLICMDFFSGSSTTAEAVMRLNNEDDGNRKFIMVQLPEDLDENLQTAEEAEKKILRNAIALCDALQKPHLLTEVAKERIRRAGAKIRSELKAMIIAYQKQIDTLNSQNPIPSLIDDKVEPIKHEIETIKIKLDALDTGFRVFRVDDSNMEDVYFQPAALRQEDLASLFDNVKPGRTDLDLLFGAMLDWGVQLSLPMQKETIDGKDVYSVNGGDLVACFADDITENIIAHIAEKSPLRVLFRDSCFKSDADKINIFEQFKQRLGWSDEEAIKNIRVI